MCRNDRERSNCNRKPNADDEDIIHHQSQIVQRTSPMFTELVRTMQPKVTSSEPGLWRPTMERQLGVRYRQRCSKVADTSSTEAQSPDEKVQRNPMSD